MILQSAGINGWKPRDLGEVLRRLTETLRRRFSNVLHYWNNAVTLAQRLGSWLGCQMCFIHRLCTENLGCIQWRRRHQAMLLYHAHKCLSPWKWWHVCLSTHFLKKEHNTVCRDQCFLWWSPSGCGYKENWLSQHQSHRDTRTPYHLFVLLLYTSVITGDWTITSVIKFSFLTFRM